MSSLLALRFCLVAWYTVVIACKTLIKNILSVTEIIELEVVVGVNLRAENSQNECAPWQVAIHSTGSMHTNELSRPRIARPARTVTLWAR
jgi:hypothetical protein